MKQNFLLKTAGYLSVLFLLSLCINVASAQCENINGNTDWTQHNNNYGGSGSRIIYDDGTNIRLANASDNSRIGTASSTYNTIVKSSEPVNLSNQITTISTVYKQGAETQNYDTWALGWAFNPNFSGAGYNQVNPSTNGGYNNIWLANIYGQGNLLYVNTAKSSGALNGPPFSYVLKAGDEIMASLVPQPDGTAAMHVVVKRVVGGVSTKVLDVYQYNAVTAANVTYSTTNPAYPALSILNGAVNLGCLQTDLRSYASTSPVAEVCESISGYPTTSGWQQRNTGGAAANSYIYDDGTNIRLAAVSDNSRLGDNTYPNYNVIIKPNEPTNLSASMTSITATYKQGNNTQNYDRWAIGWVANPEFNGNGYNVINNPAYGINYNTNWSANVYIQGSQLYINDYSSYIEVVPDYVPTYGDVITASLEPQPDGTAALHVVATRMVSGVNKEVLNIYDFMAVDAAGVSHGPVYPALEIITGAVNLSCLSSKSVSPTSLPAPIGSIAAFVQNGMLQVNWQTLTEKNNDHFEIEVSKDGKTWSKAGNNINTKATDPNATSGYSYEQSISLTGVTVMGMSLFLLSMGMMFRRSKWLGSMLIIISVSAALYGCSKNDVVSTEQYEKLYVRVKQVDTDGAVTYSKVVIAVSK